MNIFNQLVELLRPQLEADPQEIPNVVWEQKEISPLEKELHETFEHFISVYMDQDDDWLLINRIWRLYHDIVNIAERNNMPSCKEMVASEVFKHEIDTIDLLCPPIVHEDYWPADRQWVSYRERMEIIRDYLNNRIADFNK